jgi:hypothetical protein
MALSASGRRRLALLAAAIAWVWSWWALLVGLVWGLDLRCDESCSGDGWRHTQDTWQWYVVAALGLGAFAAGLMLIVLVWRRRVRAAAIAVVAEAVCGAALAVALAPGWWQHLDSRNAWPLALTAASGVCAVVAVLLTRRATAQ